MTINDLIQFEKTRLVDFLRENAGQYFSAERLSGKLSMPKASARQMLVELAENELIRRSSNLSTVTFYIPSAEQLAAERKVVASAWKPLRPRHEMAARIAQLAAERAMYPSVC